MRDPRYTNTGFVQLTSVRPTSYSSVPVHFVPYMGTTGYVTHTACGIEVHLPGHSTANVRIAEFSVLGCCGRCRRSVSFRQWLKGER
jgi:hypothetical protein